MYCDSFNIILQRRIFYIIILNKAVIKIKVFVPTYFDKFKCIADKCPDTCCIGWEVDIDPETAERYSSIGGELGKKIRQHLVRDEEGCDIFTLCEGDRCPFLNSCKLCEIQLEAGENALSKTCSLFPRFFDDFGKICEMGLGFGCPEAARIILEDDDPFSLTYYDEYADSIEDIDEDFLGELIELRAKMFTVLEDYELNFSKKVETVLKLARDFQKNLDGEAFDDSVQNRIFDFCIAILENMEYISEERKSFVKKLRNIKLSKNAINHYSSDFEKLLKYYIFRYLLKAVYDYDVLTKVKYGVFACVVISRIYDYLDFPDFETRVQIMYSYSKEVEYSDVNMDLLDKMLFENFGTDDLTNMV